MRMSLMVAAGLSLAVASPSHAAQVLRLGRFSAGQEVFDGGSIDLGPGKYRFTLALSVVNSNVWGEVNKRYRYNYWYYMEDDRYWGGNSGTLGTYLEQVTPTGYQADLQVSPATSKYSPDMPGLRRDDHADVCCDYYFGISEADRAGRYRFSVSAVPEPETWALMMLGIGVIGVKMRRQRRNQFNNLGPTWGKRLAIGLRGAAGRMATCLRINAGVARLVAIRR